ncbi:MAG: hypothetical protein VYE22_08640 [Myxococcota bacterium]|nr:hypothetical protein [Myxococcota bacterium]
MELLETLNKTRDAWISRGTLWAAETRDRGVAALDAVRGGALDWHATLDARRAQVAEADARWSRLQGLQLLVLDRMDRVLLAFGDRVRAEIHRLSRLELSAEASPAAAPTPKKKPAKQKAAAKKTAAKKTAPKKTAAAKKKTAAKKAATNGARKRSSTRLLMPIAGYDDLTAKQILAELDGLSRTQCETVREHESKHKKRKTVLRALETRLQF